MKFEGVGLNKNPRPSS